MCSSHIQEKENVTDAVSTLFTVTILFIAESHLISEIAKKKLFWEVGLQLNPPSLNRCTVWMFQSAPSHNTSALAFYNIIFWEKVVIGILVHCFDPATFSSYIQKNSLFLFILLFHS